MFYPDLGQEIGRYEPDKGKGFGNLTGSYYGFGNKYLPKYNDNPPPGYYQPGPGFDVTNPKSTSAHIRIPNGYKVYRGDNPDAGQYDPNKGKEGREMGNMRQRIYLGGGKYSEKYNDVPPPGYYNPD